MDLRFWQVLIFHSIGNWSTKLQKKPSMSLTTQECATKFTLNYSGREEHGFLTTFGANSQHQELTSNVMENPSSSKPFFFFWCCKFVIGKCVIELKIGRFLILFCFKKIVSITIRIWIATWILPTEKVEHELDYAYLHSWTHVWPYWPWKN